MSVNEKSRPSKGRILNNFAKTALKIKGLLLLPLKLLEPQLWRW